MTEVSSQTIHNCFHHCRFEKDFEENFNIEEDLPQLKNISKAAIEVECHIPEDLHAKTFPYFNNHLIASEKLSDHEIIVSGTQKVPETDIDTDEEKDNIATPSKKEVHIISVGCSSVLSIIIQCNQQNF